MIQNSNIRILTYIFKIDVGFWDKNTIFFDFYVL